MNVPRKKEEGKFLCDIGFGGKVGRKEQGRPDRVETKEGGREREGNLIYSNEMREVFCAPVCATPTVTGSAMPDRSMGSVSRALGNLTTAEIGYYD